MTDQLLTVANDSNPELNQLADHERLLQGQNQIMEMIWSGQPDTAVLNQITRLIEQIIPDSICTIMLLAPEGQHLLSCAVSNMPPGYAEQVNRLEIGPLNGTCGRAASTGQLVVSSDLLTDPLWMNYQHLVEQFGLRSCWSMPIISRLGSVLGTFAIYGRVPRTPSTKNFEVMQSLARLAAIAMESQRVEQELAAKDVRFRALVEHSFDAIMTMNNQGILCYDSPSASRLLGYQPGFSVGRHFLEFVHPDDHPLALQLFHHLLTGLGASFKMQRLRVLNANNEYRWIEVSARNMLDDANIGVIILNWREIHQQLIIEEQLRQQQWELAHATRLLTMSEMVGGISHEINQPLYAIKNFATALLAKSDQQTWPHLPKALDWLQEIAHQADRAGEILDRLRNFVKKHPHCHTLLEPAELANAAVQLLELDTVAREISVQLDIAEELPALIGDRILLQQVLVNLLQNAFEATTAGHSRQPVKLVIKQKQQQLQFSVIDQGIGLDDQARQNVFDPFYTTKTGGLGLGLTICRSIIESLHGTIWVVSNQPTGTCFHFSIPIYQPDQTAGLNSLDQGATYV